MVPGRRAVSTRISSIATGMFPEKWVRVRAAYRQAPERFHVTTRGFA